MTRVSANQPLLPSLLDRLMDRPTPGASRPGRSDAQVLSEIKLSVRRDLENLLNTRYRCKSWPPDLSELETSLVNYGLPDFTGVSIGLGLNREEYRRLIERTIRRYEPRFKSVRVHMQGGSEPLDRTLRFRVEAVLNVSPAPPEPVVFDTALEPTTAEFSVKRASR